MTGVAKPINLTYEERLELETWVRRPTTEHRLVRRARMVLEAAAGTTTTEIAALLHERTATVSTWRTRFHRQRVAGLRDAPRSGKPPTYDKSTERRILKQLDEPPPDGYTTWTGTPPGRVGWWPGRWGTSRRTRCGGCSARMIFTCSAATVGV